MISATWPVALAFEGRKPLPAKNAIHKKIILLPMDKIRPTKLLGDASPVTMRLALSTLKTASARFAAISPSDTP